MILGISADPVESHQKFCDSLKLPFDLLADTKMKGHKAFGFKKKARALFLIDTKGIVRFANLKFNVRKKAAWDELSEAVAALKSSK